MSKFPPTPVALPPSSSTGAYREQIEGIAACRVERVMNKLDKLNPKSQSISPLYCIQSPTQSTYMKKAANILYFRLNIFRKLPFPYLLEISISLECLKNQHH